MERLISTYSECPSEPSDQLVAFCSSGPRSCIVKISGDQMQQVLGNQKGSILGGG